MLQADQIIQTRLNNVLGFPLFFRGALDVRADFNQWGNEVGQQLSNCKTLPKRGQFRYCEQGVMVESKLGFGRMVFNSKQLDARLITTQLQPAVAKGLLWIQVWQNFPRLKDWDAYEPRAFKSESVIDQRLMSVGSLELKKIQSGSFLLRLITEKS